MQQERRIADRRRRDASPFSYYRLLGRRRAAGRRSGERAVAGHSDLYPKQFMAVAVSIMLLCLMDAVNTLYLLQRGAEELNPVMDLLIQRDPQLFIACKLMLTGLGMIMLMAYHDARIGIGIRVRSILYGTLFGYALLILYQWSLFRSLA